MRKYITTILFLTVASLATNAQLLLQRGYCCPASITSYNGGTCIKVCFPPTSTTGDACYNTKFGGTSYELITIAGVNYYHGEANTAGSNCQYYGRTPGAPICTGSGTGTAVSLANVSQLSVYDVGTATTSNTYSCAVVLPVELLAFDAAKGPGRTALIQWQARQDGPFFYQDLQRSADGNIWETIYTEKVLQPSASPTSRLYTDKPPATPDLFYYRLQLTDENGFIRYSPIRPVRFDAAPNSVTVFPNPVKSILSVTGNGTAINRLELFDNAGRQVKSPVQPNSSNAIMNMGNLPPGFYMLKVTYGNGTKIFKVEKL